MEENIGVLLHKLTKYQTLLSNTNSHQKRAIYNQKINSYSNKLNKIGVNQRNINQLGGLIAGALTPEEMRARKAAIDAQQQNIVFKRPELDLNVKQLTGEVTASIAKLREQIEAHKSTIETNKSTIEQLEKDIRQKEEIVQQLTKDKELLSKEKEEMSVSYEELANDYEKAMSKFLEYQTDVEKTTGEAQSSNQQNVQELMSNLEKIAAEPTLEKESQQIMGTLTGEKQSSTPVAEEQPAAASKEEEQPAAASKEEEQPVAASKAEEQAAAADKPTIVELPAPEKPAQENLEE